MRTASSNGHVQRFTRGRNCPVCGGSDGDPRGQGRRCHGFLTGHGGLVHCSREEHAGPKTKFDAGSQCYVHTARGPCPCGVEHAPADPAPARRKGRGEIDQVYKYHGRDGAVLFEVVRFKDPKGFRQRRPLGNGQYAWNLAGITPVLFKLPELLAADPSEVVWIPEGEKDVRNLGERGLVATCNPMGAKKWRDHYSDDLRGRHVVILPDNDPDGREHAQQVARSLLGKAASVRIVQLPGLPEKGDVSDFLAAGGTVDRLRELGRRAPQWKPSATEDPRPAIEVNHLRHVVKDRTLNALEADPDLYCRGETLGIVVAEEGDTAKLPGGVELRHARGNLRFVPLAHSVLGCHLTRLASFFKSSTDRNGEPITIDVHPPDWLIAAISEHRYWPGVRRLLSITECPYVRADGSLARPGFDPATGALYRPSVEIEPLPERPTRKEAQRAKDRLFELVHQFPFEDGYSFAVWLAYLLTCIQRPATAGPAPGFAFNGNAAGVGKGLLIDLAGILVWGHPVGTRTYPTDPNEAEKVKLSLAMAAVPIVHFDNLAEGGFYGGGVIDSALTSMFAEGRILGQTRESGALPLRPVWTLSGNNVSPIKDAGRRWLPCNLVTNEEKPHERRDIETKDLREHVLKNRAPLLREALTILKAHALAGRPIGPSDPKDPTEGDWALLGSYEEWDLIVRGAVWFATGADCLHTQHKGEDERPDRLEKMALLLGWKEADPDGRGMTVEEAILAAEDPHRHPILRGALLNISGDNKLPNVRKLAYKIRSMRKTPINRMRFVTCGENRNHQSRWRVVDCS